ncbi:MAG: biotin transporter BioY, partial [Haloechinothrix sp.]
MITDTLSGAHRRPATLADLFVPAFGAERTSTALRAVLLIVAGAAITALAAQLRFTVPWTPVPYTGQTGAVLLVGVALGSRLGAASMTLYLVAGVMGLPIFTNGSSGVAQVLGVTGGYLIAFVIAAALVGWLAERGWY